MKNALRFVSILLCMVMLIPCNVFSAGADLPEGLWEEMIENFDHSQAYQFGYPNDLELRSYYGEFDGYHIGVFDYKGGVFPAVKTIVIRNHEFSFANFGDEKGFFAYKDGKFEFYDTSTPYNRFTMIIDNLSEEEFMRLVDKAGATLAGSYTTYRDGFIWDFDAATGTMTVMGKGKMYDYGHMIPYGVIYNSPAYMDDNIKHVVIEEGITYIGESSFDLCKNIETISLPESLREIGDYAFASSCDSLTALEIPAGVRKIGRGAFLSSNWATPNWDIIKFYGNPPEIEEYGLFTKFRGIVYHPYYNWTDNVKTNYEKNSYKADILWKTWNAPYLNDIEEIFLDLSYGSWYVDAVDNVYRANAMKGASSTTFAPTMKMTREQAVQVLYNMSGEALSYDDYTFTDVPTKHWAANAIGWASTKGITNGIGGGKFGLGQMLTREQLATMLVNYATYENFDTFRSQDLSTFADYNEISDWALTGLEFCAETGIIKGTDKNTINPKGLATRAEMAQMVSNWLIYRSDITQITFDTNDRT
ncbi:MAG: hypothetical protein E7652_08635 [Ruminococcaceae bacterium]|nr:hypothetical protein [Oscillospiraceae bacterium]